MLMEQEALAARPMASLYASRSLGVRLSWFTFPDLTPVGREVRNVLCIPAPSTQRARILSASTFALANWGFPSSSESRCRQPLARERTLLRSL